jgi:hypothetical protein
VLQKHIQQAWRHNDADAIVEHHILYPWADFWPGNLGDRL